jgi:septum formation protein
VTDAPELTFGPPEEVVLENAFRKARAAADALSIADSDDTAVLGVDTIVAVGPRIFGKPADRDDAIATLAQLQGRDHAVLSGVCLIHDGATRTAAARTVVRFRSLDAAQIEAYADTGEWRGRAGGYAIQERGALLVTSIEGDYLNVVGLPVAVLADLAPWLLSERAAQR